MSANYTHLGRMGQGVLIFSLSEVVAHLQAVPAGVESLSTFPERGAYPKELVALGIRDYRQTAFNPYRVIYRVMAQKVFIYMIADGRRDMQSLLARHLLGV